MTLKDNLHKIQDQLSSVVPKPELIKIVGVTKFQPVEKVQEALNAGIHCLGVNYAQDGEKLRAALDGSQAEWHFIGHIQSRKIKYLPHYGCVQSLDRIEVAQDLNERLLQEKKTLSVFVELNLGEEPQKSGVKPVQLEELLKDLQALSALQVTGLMTMPPPLFPVERRRPYFDRLVELFSKAETLHPLQWLSMGTSEDYLVAAQAGANMLRLGTCLFGERPSHV